jgi:hypothetical protein
MPTEFRGELLVEMVDLTEEAARVGLRCRRVHVAPEVIARVDGASLLEQIRAALVATEDDRRTALFRAVLLRGERVTQPPATPARVAALRQFILGLRAGIGGASDDGRLLALQVRGREGPTTVVCSLRLAPDPVPDFLATQAEAIHDRHPALLVGAADAAETSALFPWG